MTVGIATRIKLDERGVPWRHLHHEEDVIGAGYY
jgi:hypothetical protein